MAWEIALARRCTSIIQWRLHFFFGYIKIKTGVTVIALHTMVQGTLLFLPLLEQSEGSSNSKKMLSVPNESRLLSGLLASPFLITGISLFQASIRPKIGLLDGYVIGTQCIIVLFPAVFTLIYVRTFVETAENAKHLADGGPDAQQEIFALFTYLYLSLSYAIVSYILLFYNVILVLSYKDEVLTKWKETRVEQSFYNRRMEALLQERIRIMS